MGTWPSQALTQLRSQPTHRAIGPVTTWSDQQQSGRYILYALLSHIPVTIGPTVYAFWGYEVESLRNDCAQRLLHLQAIADKYFHFLDVGSYLYPHATCKAESSTGSHSLAANSQEVPTVTASVACRAAHAPVVHHNLWAQLWFADKLWPMHQHHFGSSR